MHGLIEGITRLGPCELPEARQGIGKDWQRGLAIEEKHQTKSVVGTIIKKERDIDGSWGFK